MKTKPIIYSLVIVIAAAWIYRGLITGGWLTNHYRWNDPDIINLFLAILEPIVVLIVAAYWIWRTQGLYRLLFVSFVVQLITGAGFLAFILFFFFTWKPKLM
ncbi:MAG: hypothetical protein WAO00_17185 [Chthoniobacterales bacterium]